MGSMSDKENPGPENIKAVSPSHPLNRSDQIVRRLRAGVRDPVVEIGQDRPFPVLEGGQESAKGRPDLRIEACVPFLVSTGRLRPGGGLIDVVELLLRLVSLDQNLEILAPFVQALSLDLVQLRKPLQKNMAIAHQGSPLLGRKRPSHGLPESVQGGVGHLQNMELVHDDGDPRQGLPDGVLVGTPHVDGHAPDPSL